jgi:hypothetical protein
MTTQQIQALHVQGLEKSFKKLRVLRGIGLFLRHPCLGR